MSVKNAVYKVKSLFEMASLVKGTGRSYLSQISDLLRLKAVNKTSGISDYYWYKMYDPEIRAREDFTNYVGWRAHIALNESLNPRISVTGADDKLLFAVIANAHDFPTPKIKAVFKGQGGIPKFVPVGMESINEVKAFLLNQDNYPVFMKPAFAQSGVGGFYLDHFNKDTEEIITKSGYSYSFDQLMKKSILYPEKAYYRREAGYLFQEAITQHSAISEFQGSDAPSGIRVVVLNDDRNPVVFRAIWKIIANGNTKDNFGFRGKYGNLMAGVDTATGKVSDAIDDFWPYAKEHKTHPQTGNAFSDFRIPMWNQLLENIKKASTAFSMMRILHWDIVITNNGPVFIELNDLGGTEILQMFGQGLMNQTMRQYMKKWASLNQKNALTSLVQCERQLNPKTDLKTGTQKTN